jgi:integrase
LCLLTARQVLTAQRELCDGGNLYLDVDDKAASWVFRFMSPISGKRRFMGLGAVDRSSLGAAGHSLVSARELAAQARAVVAKGLDPIDERERLQEERRQAAEQEKIERHRREMTLGRAAVDYHRRVIATTRTPKHSAQWMSSLQNHVPPALWDAPIGTITAPALLAALTAIRPHERARNLSQGHRIQETVQRIRQRLEVVFEDAVFHGWCGTNPAAAIKRKLREVMPRRQRGQFAALPYIEVPDLMRRLRDVEGIAARCLEWTILTVARTGEAISAEWSEIDFRQSVWTVSALKMKAKEQHTVFLSKQAVELLQGLRGLHERWVFPSPRMNDRHLSNMAMLATLDHLGLRDRTSVHGLARACFSTWANESGAARPDVIEASLAHAESNRVRAAYNRAQFAAERRALLESWAKYLLDREPAQVLPLRAA